MQLSFWLHHVLCVHPFLVERSRLKIMIVFNNRRRASSVLVSDCRNSQHYAFISPASVTDSSQTEISAKAKAAASRHSSVAKRRSCRRYLRSVIGKHNRSQDVCALGRRGPGSGQPSADSQPGSCDCRQVLTHRMPLNKFAACETYSFGWGAQTSVLPAAVPVPVFYCGPCCTARTVGYTRALDITGFRMLQGT